MQEHERLVDCDEEGEVSSVLEGGLEDELEFVLVRARPKEIRHDQSMRKTDLCAVDCSIPKAFDDGEEGVEGGVVDVHCEQLLRVERSGVE